MAAFEIFFVASILFLLVIAGIVFLRYGILKSKIITYPAIKHIAVIAVIIALISYFLLYVNYKIEIEQSKNSIAENKLKDFLTVSKSDSNLNLEKSRLIDSIAYLKHELEKVVKDLERKKFVTGVSTDVIKSKKELVSIANVEIADLSQYNQRVDVKSLIPNYKGHISSGNSEFISFTCPPRTAGEFTIIDFTINDKKLFDSMACIYVSAVKYLGEKDYGGLFTGFYEPNFGKNVIRLRNVTNIDSSILEIGYFTKSESLKEYPRLEKISCRY